jgi:hypothetical protein
MSQPTLYIDNYGNKRWFLNGNYHREDGPAIKFKDGKKCWFLNGQEYSFEKWFKKLTPNQQEKFLWNLDE